MKRLSVCKVFLAAVSPLIFSTHGSAQITSNEGDGVLNSPYRGTINSLRECTADIGYGEVLTHVEPISNDVSITSSSIDIWVEGAWDRSVLRVFEGLDASGSEIDLTGTSEFAPATVFTDGNVKYLSFKAIGTKTLAPQTFTIRMSYLLNGSPSNPSRTVTVEPITGSFCALPGESEAFLLGTPILDVAVGNARLTIPVGRTVEMVGAVFIDKNVDLGPTLLDTYDVLFPGAAETVYIQDNNQFRLGGTANKTDWGTPWPGYLVGYQANSSDVFGPDGTHFDSLAEPSTPFRRIDYIRPKMQREFVAAAVKYVYDSGVHNRVIEIRDQAATPNVITLTRSPTDGDVTRITTSDGRGWDVDSDPVAGWITAVIPDSGKGKRSFTYNTAGRITHVKDALDNLMYEFVFVNDPGGMPTILTEERRFVDGALETVVEHEIMSESLRRRTEFTGSVEGGVRQLDFAYDTANGLNHRLASISSSETPGSKPFTTTFTHDVNNEDGSMVVMQVDLPDGTTINHEYDSHIGGQTVDFGFRTKSTRSGPNDGSLVIFDVDYEFFYTSGSTRLFFQPRIVKRRDGRGAISEVTFDYDNGGQFVDCCTQVQGQDLNRLLSITGPVITTGSSPTRTPQKEFTYDNSGAFPTYLLSQTETKRDATNLRIVAFAHDELRRVVSTTTDPGGLNIVTQSLYCDTEPTQDRITVDADYYWVRTQFDNDGRVISTERYLDANAGNVSTPCAAPTGPFYAITNTFDTNGRLDQRLVDNKDQDGVLLGSAIVTTFEYDRLGRLELQTIDPAPGINSESHFDYNWLGDIEREFDTSGRGTSRTYDGRGLVKTETPLAVGAVPDTDLKTTFAYDAMYNLRLTDRPALRKEERMYDDFDRLEHIQADPGSGGGKTITTRFEYDNANNVKRTVVDEDGTVLSDTTALYDEGGFNYETRQRLVAGADNDVDPVDPLTSRKFDWAGNVTEERSRGDATVIDRVVTTEYDDAERVDRILDSEGGETAFTLRDGRGNVTLQTVKINATDSAVTNMVYDALSRAVQVTEPEDGVGGRADVVRRYDSRGNLLRESIRDAADVPKLTTVFAYDDAGRQTRRAVLADATAATVAANADVTVDRVTDFQYDADGRLRFRHRYNNNLPTPLTTETTYDALGRIDLVIDPSGSFTDDDYADDGRLDRRTVFDGVGTRTLSFGYDGHDRVTSQTALGTPALVISFEWDGLDRRVRTIDPRTITTRTDYDLVGRQTRLVEDESGALERLTDFAYNSLSQLSTQTTKNTKDDGTPLSDQVTTYRYDSLGRRIRTVYPDADLSQHGSPLTCTDCVQNEFDFAGRMTQRTDQRGIPTAFTYEDRGGLLTRTTGSDVDTFDYDSAGRLTLAERGTTVGPDPDAVSKTTREYTDMGDLDFEMQTIAGGTVRTIDYSHDQAGNRMQLTYPGTEVLTYTPTVLDQVDSVTLNAAPFLDYDYNGRLLGSRRTITSDPGGDKVYAYDLGYDVHRRVNAVVNRFESGARASQTIVGYGFSHDKNGNPLTQTVAEGMPVFLTDDRAFTVDRLNRLTGTEYFENGQVESSTIDLAGNRESHTDRTGTTTPYGTVNAANEYPTIAGSALTYDQAGNLSVDRDGRQYTYDEQNRLTQIKASDQTVLANFTYDALGRRIVFENPVAGVTTRYYYDGKSVIEERDGACPGPTCDLRLRYHVNGAQYIDERVATYTEAAALSASGRATLPPTGSGERSLPTLENRRGVGEFTYYLPTQNHSIAATGNADGTVIERLNYSSTGDLAGGGPGAVSFFHDADADLDLDLRDIASFQNCFGQTDPTCLSAHDFDTADVSDGDIDLDDHARFAACINGPFFTPGQSCGMPARAGAPPPSGAFTLHGRPVDILSDGHALLDFRARHYDPVLGRWLQRDPLPYNDGPNLYEPFRSNPLRFSDPYGRQTNEPGVLDSFVEFLRRFQTGADPFTGEDLVDRALRRAGAIDEPNPALRAFYEQADVYEDAAVATIRDAEPVLARGVGVVQVAGGLAETGTGLVLVIYSEGLGAAPGTVFVLHGIDVAQAGGRQVLSGQFTPTLTFETISDAGYPKTALVVDAGISLGSGYSALQMGVEGIALPARGISTTVRATDPASEALLVAQYPAISPKGEVNLLNVVRRGVPLTMAEATAGKNFPGIGRVAEQRFLQTLFRPLVQGQRLFGRGVGRLGDLTTRSFTMNEASLAEFFGAQPIFEQHFPATAGSRVGRFLDLAISDPQGMTQIQFIRLEQGKIPVREIRATRDILLRSGQPVVFIVTGRR